MLRKFRIIIAIFCITFITLLFLDFTGTIHCWFGWIAKIQFFPALLALNLGVVIGLIILTLLFGRLYCSVICPLGIFQDVISRLASKRRKNRFFYSPAISWLRYFMLAVFVIALFAGASVLVSVLEPYSAYGRMVSSAILPLYQWGNNILAGFAERADSYTFYPVDIWLKGFIPLLIAGITFTVLAVLAWRNGRTYCNTICPVGTILGVVSRFSLFRPAFVQDNCNGCGLCARNCKAACINAKARTVDYSRCVSCMDCMDKCKQGAMKYVPHYIVRKRTRTEIINPAEKKERTVAMEAQPVPGKNNSTRRDFLSITTLFAFTAAVKAQEKKVDGGLAVIEDKKIPNRQIAVLPPGAQSARNLTQHCTACQLCVSACPNNILHPSNVLSRLMQPEMSFERGYCRPECNRCSQVCPAGAIRPVSVPEKSAIQIGHAVWVKENCLPYTEDVRCRNCARHCPAGAIQMVPRELDDPESTPIPVVNTERCIGCGACENLCPSRPFSAIYVEGHTHHRII